MACKIMKRNLWLAGISGSLLRLAAMLIKKMIKMMIEMMKMIMKKDDKDAAENNHHHKTVEANYNNESFNNDHAN